MGNVLYKNMTRVLRTADAALPLIIFHSKRFFTHATDGSKKDIKVHFFGCPL
jgi:hypothetical protein